MKIVEPILTLPYSEWVVAEQLASLLPARLGYSVFAPLSRQEKGVDLVLLRRSKGESRAATIQVKASRTYTQPESRGYKFGTWFNRFDPPEEADFFTLVSLYPTAEGRNVGKRDSWWSPVILLFTNEEMRSLMKSVKTVGGKPDKMFGFGYSSPERVIQIRGDQLRRQQDFSRYLIKKRKKVLQAFVTAV